MGTSVTLEIRRCVVLVFHFKDQGGYPVLKGRYPAYSTSSPARSPEIENMKQGEVLQRRVPAAAPSFDTANCGYSCCVMVLVDYEHRLERGSTCDHVASATNCVCCVGLLVTQVYVT